MIRPLLSLDRLSFDEREGKICCRFGKKPEEVERMDYLSALVTHRQACLHPFCSDLYFPMMVEWENDTYEALPATAAENEFLIFKSNGICYII